MRAGAIALAIVFGLIEGCPLPPSDKTLPWQQPIVDIVRPVRHVLVRPVAWIGPLLKITQRWALFQGAPRDRYRLEIEGKQDGAWQLLFRARDPDHDAYARFLLDERVRGAWNPLEHPPATFGPFREWFLRHVLADRPELSAVRMHFERVVIDHGELRGTGNFVMPFEVAR